MCSQAIVNPEDLKHFARDLKQFNGQLRDNVTRLNAGFGRLGETWRDQEHQKFARQFEQTVRVLRQFMQAADEQVPLLLAKAQAADDYLKRRIT